MLQYSYIMIHFKPSKCSDVCVRLTKVVKVVKEMSNVKCQHIITNLCVREQKMEELV